MSLASKVLESMSEKFKDRSLTWFEVEDSTEAEDLLKSSDTVAADSEESGDSINKLVSSIESTGKLVKSGDDHKLYKWQGLQIVVGNEGGVVIVTMKSDDFTSDLGSIEDSY